MVRYGLGLTIVAVAAAAIGVPAAASASASSAVTCGETITHNVTLSADLDCLSTPALKFGASGVTLNLNGHEVSGGIRDPGPKAAVSDNGYGSVTIRNGSVEGNTGLPIRFTNASNVHIVDVGSDTNSGPLVISGGSGIVIESSSFRGNGGSIITGSDDLQITGSGFHSDGNQAALTLNGVDNANIADNGLTEGDPGLLVTGSGNLIEGNSGIGVEVAGGSGNLIEGNTFEEGTATGITVDAGAQRTQVRSNTLQDGQIEISGSSTTISGNTVGPGPGDGIDVSGSAAQILANTVNDSSADGIYVSGPGARITHNTTNNSGTNGIEVSDPTAHIAHNIADDNTLYGITATPGDTGTANTAAGNNSVGGVPGEQCLNIECEAGTSEESVGWVTGRR